VNECCLTPNEKRVSCIMAITSYGQCNGEGVRFVLDQHA